MTHGDEISDEITDPEFEVLHFSGGDVVAIRVGRGSRQAYAEFYRWLAQLTAHHGVIRVYEEAPGWSASTFLSHIRATVPDLRYGPNIVMDKYACIGDTMWPKLMYRLWRLTKPFWPMAPRRMRYYDWSDRDKAKAWVLDRTS